MTLVTVVFIGKPIFYQRENNDLCRESLNRSNNHAHFLGELASHFQRGD